MVFRFIQTSDLHLGSPMTASSLRLPADKAERRRRELRQVLADACALTRSENADALLIPGDLFDDESVTTDELGFAIEQFGRLGRPVFVAPGNHDYSSSSSVYAADNPMVRHGLDWSANVRIFRHQTWETFNLDEASIIGLGFQTHVAFEDRLLQRVVSSPGNRLRVLLFHGSRDAFLPQGKQQTLPFSDAELAQTGCQYAAVGHYHDYQTFEVGGRILGAYSGCPAGRGLDECGQKVVLKVEIDDTYAVSVQPVQLDRRRIVDVPVDCTGCLSNESICTAIAHTTSAAGCVAEDIVHVQLTGTAPPGLALELPRGFLEDRFFAIRCDATGVRPGYDLALYAEGGAQAETTEGRFVRRLLGRLGAARANGDEAQAALIEQAIDYGLDALHGEKLKPRGLG